MAKIGGARRTSLRRRNCSHCKTQTYSSSRSIEARRTKWSISPINTNSVVLRQQNLSAEQFVSTGTIQTSETPMSSMSIQRYVGRQTWDYDLSLEAYRHWNMMLNYLRCNLEDTS
jgi:hypothetical protein